MDHPKKRRMYHFIHGRLRIKISGLQNNPDVAKQFVRIFSGIHGVIRCEANPVSGNVLLYFNEEVITVEEISYYILQFEEFARKEIQGLKEKKEVCSPSLILHNQRSGFYEAAVSIDNDSYRGRITAQNGGRTSPFQTKPIKAPAHEDEKVPITLSLPLFGFGLLGIKQLFWGRSPLAKHPVPFYIAGILSVCSGYPFIKRRLQKLFKERKLFNFDFLLTVSTLSLALLRENLVVLAGLSLIQFLKWQYQRPVSSSQGQDYAGDQVNRYAKRASKLGFFSAAAAFALTRNPIASLAVLLAMNPKPASVSTEYVWKHADYTAELHKCVIPKNGSVYQLSRMNTLVFEDASHFIEKQQLRKECIPLLKQLKGGKIAIANHVPPSDQLKKIQQELSQYQVQLVDINRLSVKRREDVLVISNGINKENNIVSFYPSCTIAQLNAIADSRKAALQIEKSVKRNVRITKIWNIIGTMLAVPLFVSAPLIGLTGDALALTFMSLGNRSIEQLFAKPSTAELETERAAAMIPWHAKPTDEIVTVLKSHENLGLNNEQVQSAITRYGKNQLVSKSKPHWTKTYFGQFKEFTTLVLGATAVLSMVTGHLFDGLIMGGILLINAGIGTIQERKADRAVETMGQFVPPQCRVIRHGEGMEIQAYDLVPGDIVELEAGDRIPADLRIIQAWNLEVNESTLTGESLPVEKKENILLENEPLSDRKNMLYMGTHVTRGKCRAIVVQTGKHTEMGHLLSLLTEEEDHATPLQKQVSSISKRFMKGALLIGVLVFVSGLLRGVPLTEMIATSVALTSSAIPEGLPITITFALTAGVFRMANKKALVRKLSALETLGRTTVICSDKTGTLTKNEMTVKRIATVDSVYEVSGEGYSITGDIHGSETNPLSKDLDQILKIGLLCNNAQLLQEEQRWNIKGDPTEGALLTLAAKRGLTQENHGHWKRVGEAPFDSAAGKMSVLWHEENRHEQCFVMTKGSVDKIVNECKYYQKNGVIYPMDEWTRSEILLQNDTFAKQALRVLGFAYSELNRSNSADCLNEADYDLIYAGMVGMMDPPKPEVEKSIQDALQLGIQPVMITGDHPLTALAIAREIGIYNEQKKLVTGQDLDLITDEELEAMIDDVAIYARVTPEHKLRIVSILQNKGHIVAMTGDGVNDSPAIKKADIGIAMGQTGTQVTKETSDMVLKEDHFGTIVDGVKEGRTIIGNIRKAIGCLLSGNLAEIIVTSMAVMAGLPLPIVPVQILLMNMLTDALPAMVLAVNPGNQSTETKRQEIVDSTLYKQVITRGVLLGLGSLGLFIFSLKTGMSLAAAQTVAFASLVSGQLMQTFSWRQEGSRQSFKDWSKDRFMIGALGISWVSLLSVIYIPQLAGIFKTAPLPLMSWIPIVLVAAVSLKLTKPIVNLLVMPKMAIGKREIALT